MKPSIKLKKIGDDRFGIAVDFYHAGIAAIGKKTGRGFDYDLKMWLFGRESTAMVLDYLQREFNFKIGCDFCIYKITAKQGLRKTRGPLTLNDINIARATGRDSGAQLGFGIRQISGGIGSGGSLNNWATTISEGAVFELTLPVGYSNTDDERWDVEPVDQTENDDLFNQIK